MRSRMLAATILAVLAVAPAAAQRPSGFCARVAVGTEAVDPLELGPSTFSASQIQDLRFAVLFHTEVRGDHLLEMRLSTPQGHHYETLTVPLTTTASERGGRRTVEGFPRPLHVHLVESTSTREGRFQGTVVETRLPVAGTSIVNSSLYGTWRIELVLDGREMDCELRNFFVLEP